jgi:hypothetical protein
VLPKTAQRRAHVCCRNDSIRATISIMKALFTLGECGSNALKISDIASTLNLIVSDVMDIVIMLTKNRLQSLLGLHGSTELYNRRFMKARGLRYETQMRRVLKKPLSRGNPRICATRPTEHSKSRLAYQEHLPQSPSFGILRLLTQTRHESGRNFNRAFCNHVIEILFRGPYSRSIYFKVSKPT